MLNGIDLNHYDYDRHNTLFYFVINQHEHIYLRFGGRNSDAAEKYLNLDALELALKSGLQQFQDKPEAGISSPNPKTLLPAQLPGMNADVIKKGRCV